MIVEVIDPGSGAILFKKDKESLTLESLQRKVKELEDSNELLLERLSKLENKIEKDS